MHTDIIHHLWDAVRRQHPEKRGTNSWCLIHNNAGAHWLVVVKDSLAKINVQNWSIPHNRTWIQLIFTFSLDWNQHWWNDASLKMQQKSWKGFTRWPPAMFLIPLQLLSEVYSCTRGLSWKKCSLTLWPWKCQLNMFWAVILSIFRSTRLCVTACGIMQPWCCVQPAGDIMGALYHNL